jgi:sulfur-oxidizing protein SoxY
MRRGPLNRRDALRTLGLIAAVAAVPRPVRGQTAGAAAPGIQWNAAAFNAQSVDEALRALGAGTPAPTTEVTWGSTPEIAENGAVVPVSVTSKIPGTEAIAILIEKNPNKLAGSFYFPEGTAPALTARVKMSESSMVHALVKTKDNRYFLASREIKVTLGGCGG